MRGVGVSGFLAVCGLAGFLGGGCHGAGGPTPDPSAIPANRSGAIRLTRSSIAGGLPSESVLGVASFFLPPGPDATDSWPAHGACAVASTAPAVTATPASFLDAGALVTLTTGAASLELDRFESADGAILYVTGGAVDPASILAGDRFDLAFPGGTGSNALPPATIAGVVNIPPALVLAQPDFSLGAVMLERNGFNVTWTSAGDGDVEIRLAISGSNGAATLLCATADGGGFHAGPELLAGLPSGSGTLSVTRRVSTQTALTSSTVLVGEGDWIEGGAVTLP